MGRPQAELDVQPLAWHGNMYVIERALASTFAIAAWRAALPTEKSRDTGENMLVKFEKALSEDKSRQQLRLDLPSWLAQPAFNSLCGSIVGLVSLQQLTLNFNQCNGLTSVESLGEGLKGLQSLQQRTLSLGGCQGLTGGLDGLGGGLGSLAQLTQLTLNLRECNGLTGYPMIGRRFESVLEFSEALGRLGKLGDEA